MLFRIFTGLPLVANLVLCLLLLAHTLWLGHLPRYGTDPDPHALLNSTLIGFQGILLLVSLAGIFVSPLGVLLALVFESETQSRAITSGLLLFAAGWEIMFQIRSTSAFLWLLD